MRCELRAYRNELMNDSVKFSRSLIARIWRGSHCIIDKSDHQKRQRIKRNEQRCAKQRQQETAESRTHNSGEVQLHSSQRDRGGQLIFTDDVRNNRSPNRGAQRKPNPEREDASKHRVGIDRTCVRAPRARSAAPCSLPQNGTRITRRRSPMSASTPAGSVKRKNGAEAAVAIRESENDEAPRSCINQVAAMS